MKQLIIFIVGLLTLTQYACTELDCEQGNRRNVTEEFFVDDFDGIRLEISAEVRIQEGDDFFVEIEGEENIIDLINDRVRSGIWEIDYRRCVRTHDPVTIYITAPPLNSLTVSGSGRIIHNDFLNGRFVDLSVSGSGRIDAGVHANRIESRISGSGDIILEGTTESLECNISGSGDLRGFDLLAEEANLRISGSGSIETSVTDFLKARISGSGNIRYKGNPQLDVSTSGSGRVRDAN